MSIVLCVRLLERDETMGERVDRESYNRESMGTDRCTITS
jgi:hypothetical protein